MEEIIPHTKVFYSRREDSRSQLGRCNTEFPTWRHLGDQGAEDEKSEEVTPRGRHVCRERRQTGTNTCWGLARLT